MLKEIVGQNVSCDVIANTPVGNEVLNIDFKLNRQSLANKDKPQHRESIMTNPNEVGKYLEEVLSARPKGYVYYGTIVKRFDLPELDGIWSYHPLSQIFEVLDQQDANANRPFRTSVVVSKNKNSPGPGFYDAMERMKGVTDPNTEDARMNIWIAELRKAHDYPWGQSAS